MWVWTSISGRDKVTILGGRKGRRAAASKRRATIAGLARRLLVFHLFEGVERAGKNKGVNHGKQASLWSPQGHGGSRGRDGPDHLVAAPLGPVGRGRGRRDGADHRPVQRVGAAVSFLAADGAGGDQRQGRRRRQEAQDRLRGRQGFQQRRGQRLP